MSSFRISVICCFPVLFFLTSKIPSRGFRLRDLWSFEQIDFIIIRRTAGSLIAPESTEEVFIEKQICYHCTLWKKKTYSTWLLIFFARAFTFSGKGTTRYHWDISYRGVITSVFANRMITVLDLSPTTQKQKTSRPPFLWSLQHSSTLPDSSNNWFQVLDFLGFWPTLLLSDNSINNLSSVIISSPDLLFGVLNLRRSNLPFLKHKQLGYNKNSDVCDLRSIQS